MVVDVALRDDKKGEVSHAAAASVLLDSIPINRLDHLESLYVRTVAYALLALVATAAFGAEVYRSTDAKGNVIYSDRPENSTSRPVVVLTPHPSSSPHIVTAPPAPAEAAKPGTEQAGAPKREKREPTPAEKAEDRAKNCKIARERQQSYSVAHRLYRAGPNGERQYLSDAEIDEARAKAAADVETWCN